MLKSYRRVVAGLAAGVALAAMSNAAMAADVVVNGSFEAPGLNGWTFAAADVDPGVATCSFNDDTAPGTELATGEPGYAATDGTAIALGSLKNANLGLGTCVLYQDIVIPVGATTANFSIDSVLTTANGMPLLNSAYRVALYSTASVPNFQALAALELLAPANATGGPNLVNGTAANVDVSTLAGTTQRLAILIAVDLDNTGHAVIGLDNVQFDVTVPPPPVPTLTEWAMILFGLLLAGGAALHLSRRRMMV